VGHYNLRRRLGVPVLDVEENWEERTNRMKAIRVSEFGGPDVLKLQEVPDPAPGPKQVLVRIHAAGVNPVDTYIRTGTYARKPPLPYTPGSDGAGLIEKAGPGAERFQVGDRVYIARPADPAGGTYAEMTVCDESQVYPIPGHISFAQGAGVNVPYATAHRAIFDRARCLPGESILVHGATGGVGIAAVQLAVSHGMVVIGTGGTDRGRELVRAQGVRHVLDHGSGDYLDQLMQLTGGRGVNVIIEMLANVNLDRDLGVLAQFGRLVVVGSRGRIEIDPRRMMARESSILGMSLWMAGEEPVARAHAQIVAGLSNGTLRPIVGRELPLQEAAAAHEAVLKNNAFGKIVLVP
jgi:NADPH:quinone reductase